MFLDQAGIYETSRKACAKNYVKTGDFRIDLLSVLPFEIVYIFVGVQGWSTIFRANRVLRQYAFSRAFSRWDAATKYPTIVRMIKTINIMIILMHTLGKIYNFWRLNISLHSAIIDIFLLQLFNHVL